ncbi:MAG: nucleotidyltransferase [Pseudomonadota bacterium]
MGILAKAGTRDWETTFENWSQGPGKTEQEKCDRAQAAIRRAVEKSTKLGWRNVSAFPQGSYANRTNVRQDSDIDVCVLCRDAIVVDYPEDISDAETGLSGSGYRFAQYKDDLEAALVDHFGRRHVRRGNKAFDINENIYRVDADAAPCFRYRNYFRGSDGGVYFNEGTALYPDNARFRRVINYPRQQYKNGVAKNERTARRFKRMVRIVKKLRNEMDEAGVAAAGPVPSYLIECLVWNAPDDLFQGLTWRSTVQGVLADLWQRTGNDAECTEWTEENGIKYLFRTSQAWTRLEANDFLKAAWNYVENG